MSNIPISSSHITNVIKSQTEDGKEALLQQLSLEDTLSTMQSLGMAAIPNTQQTILKSLVKKRLHKYKKRIKTKKQASDNTDEQIESADDILDHAQQEHSSSDSDKHDQEEAPSNLDTQQLYQTLFEKHSPTQQTQVDPSTSTTKSNTKHDIQHNNKPLSLQPEHITKIQQTINQLSDKYASIGSAKELYQLYKTTILSNPPAFKTFSYIIEQYPTHQERKQVCNFLMNVSSTNLKRQLDHIVFKTLLDGIRNIQASISILDNVKNITSTFINNKKESELISRKITAVLIDIINSPQITPSLLTHKLALLTEQPNQRKLMLQILQNVVHSIPNKLFSLTPHHLSYNKKPLIIQSLRDLSSKMDKKDHHFIIENIENLLGIQQKETTLFSSPMKEYISTQYKISTPTEISNQAQEKAKYILKLFSPSTIT